MPREHAFLVEGAVIQVLSPKTYRLELSNGHQLLGFIPGKRTSVTYHVGDAVRVQLSPYDLSEGRILVETKKDLS